MASVHRPRVFLDVNIGEEPAGRLTVELFVDQAPRTSENFRQLCTGEHNGLSYAKAPFHRVIDEFMIQGGDIQNGDGTGTLSIYGEEFEDENLDWRPMDAAGLVCSANRGRDTNGSQFFITLESCEHLNGKHTIFGRLVSGEATLQRIAKVGVDKNDRPLEPVLVSRCGELEKRKKKAPSEPQKRASSISRDRGRRPRSKDSDVAMENSPEPGIRPKRRRESDNLLDEGIRGRPRQRSGSRSPSRALSTQGESDDSERASPAKKHKRKRSPSPSRQPDGDGNERRRRSLPNQYGEQRYTRDDGDRERYKPSPRRDGYQHEGRRGDDREWSKRDDRYRPPKERHSHVDDGRLGGGGYEEYEQPPVKFKGRGVMKYREPERQW